MADSKRLRILKALTSQLETVMIANGYQFDLAGKVYRGRAGFGDETPTPWVGLFELRPEDIIRAGETVNKDEWYVGLQGAVDVDEVHPTDPAHNLMADVKKALGKIVTQSPHQRNPNYMFGGLLSDLRMDGGMTFVPKEEMSTAAFAMKLTLVIAEDLENPYD